MGINDTTHNNQHNSKSNSQNNNMTDNGNKNNNKNNTTNTSTNNTSQSLAEKYGYPKKSISLNSSGGCNGGSCYSGYTPTQSVVRDVQINSGNKYGNSPLY